MTGLMNVKYKRTRFDTSFSCGLCDASYLSYRFLQIAVKQNRSRLKLLWKPWKFHPKELLKQFCVLKNTRVTSIKGAQNAILKVNENCKSTLTLQS